MNGPLNRCNGARSGAVLVALVAAAPGAASAHHSFVGFYDSDRIVEVSAMRFVVKEDESLARPNDGICDSVAVIEVWQRNGWLESTGHLDVHPAGD